MNKKPNRALMSETQRYAIFGAAFGFAFPLVGTIFRVFLSQLPINLPNMLQAQLNDPLLWVVDTAPFVLGIFAGYAGYKQDLLTKINEELRDHEYALRNSQLNLEKRVNERTADLEIANKRNEGRAAQFEAIARVARAISATQILNTLLPQISETISEQLGFYHVGIFLLDTRREYAVLAAANSEGGKKMLERKHHLQVGGKGLVGYVTKTGQPRVALDVGLDAVYFNNPDLPDTHSEIALPLQIGPDVFGALDVQSKKTNAFSQDDVNILSTLADQVSVAIQNARSYQQSLDALAQSESITAQMSEQQWRQFLNRQPIEGYHFDGVQAKPLTPSNNKQIHSLAIPLKIHGTQIGALKLSASDPRRTWTEDEIAIAQATADRAALAIENARLLLEAQKRAAKERAVGQISAKIGSLVNLENIVQTAIQELGDTLSGTDVAIQFTSGKPEQK